MRENKRMVALVGILLLVITLLTACNYKDEVDFDWVTIPQGFVRIDSTEQISENNCFCVEFVTDCDIQAQFSTNGDNGFLAYIDSSYGLIPVEDNTYRAQISQEDKLCISSFPERTQLLAMEQSFLSMIFFEKEKPIGYAVIYVAAFEIEGNKVTEEMLGGDTVQPEQTYMFYIGNMIHSVKFSKSADLSVSQIKDRVYSMEINYLLGLR